ncbi:transcription repressor NadR [Clostridiisalibacter paucivorans]|uniref:transcription repressor NadR n=1 Tax=Clostridiisalibacter paucivorans TaxID=408753 RepID=UPI0004795533|nr:transcription repressor NadR [Clostridiisalibacter paucivorans]
MDAKERRNEILRTLINTDNPIKGIDIANIFDVSRQVIVQDIAILRAKGEDIIATPQGYLIVKKSNKKLLKAIVSKHQGYDEIEDELTTIVDLGGKIIDVIVEHPLYGEIKSPLMIGSRLDVKSFMEKIKEVQAEPLSSLTDGVHIHTIEVPSEEVFQQIKIRLKEKKYLIDIK